MPLIRLHSWVLALVMVVTSAVPGGLRLESHSAVGSRIAAAEQVSEDGASCCGAGCMCPKAKGASCCTCCGPAKQTSDVDDEPGPHWRPSDCRDADQAQMSGRIAMWCPWPIEALTLSHESMHRTSPATAASQPLAPDPFPPRPAAPC